MTKIPFDWILENLFALEPQVKPMFGAHGVYARGKIILILREKNTNTDLNGVWIATDKIYHKELMKEIPALIHFSMAGEEPGHWLMLSSADDDFENNINTICEMLLRGDERLGRVTKTSVKKKT
jgi:hypothetical protein